MTVIAHSAICNTCGVEYTDDGCLKGCTEPGCTGFVSWEATADRLAEQLRGAVDVLGAIGYPSEFLQSRSALSGKAREWLQANGHTPAGGQSGALALPSSDLTKETE